MNRKNSKSNNYEQDRQKIHRQYKSRIQEQQAQIKGLEEQNTTLKKELQSAQDCLAAKEQEINSLKALLEEARTHAGMTEEDLEKLRIDMESRRKAADALRQMAVLTDTMGGILGRCHLV